MYRILIEEITGVHAPLDTPEVIKRYEQVVDQLNLRAVMAAVNQTPRRPRTKKESA